VVRGLHPMSQLHPMSRKRRILRYETFTSFAKSECTPHRRDGLRCKGPPIRGATVCRLHGRSAPQVRDAARKWILATADPVAARLIEIALNVGAETRHAINAIFRCSIVLASLGLQTAKR